MDFWTIRTIKAGLIMALPVTMAACTMMGQAVRPADPVDVVSAPAPSELPAASPADAWIEPFSISVEVARSELPPLCYEHEAPQNLVDRIRAGFALPPEENRAIERHVGQYAAHPGYLRKVLLRAERYLHHIVEELDNRSLPLELALLPVVESGFDPFAYSHGRAAGLWQFIPGTARRYDLKQNWWYDGRRDVTASTRAALDYLEHLHAKFDGDWLLAIAAYNSGEGNVQRAIRRNEHAEKPTDFWHLRLPRETKAYVPKLLAVRQIVQNASEFGLTLPRLPDVPYFEEVETGAQIDLALAAELAGTTVEEIYALNPGFNRWATDPDGPHRLLVPAGTAAAFEDALQALPEDQRTRWARYRIREGDSLSLIAARHDTTPDVLKKVNGLGSDQIQTGRHLMIPRAARPAASYTLSAESRLQRTVSRKRGGSRGTYVVQPGDNLWEIGKAHGISARQLAQWNGMALLDTLTVGQELVIWGAAAAAAPSTGAGSPAETRRRIQYTVRRGDSLWKISSKFNVSVEQLRRWNSGLKRQKYLQPGQRLVMYVDITRQSG